MAFFGEKDSSTPRRGPDEKVRVSENLQVLIWNAGNIPGRQNKIHLAFERLLKDGRSVRTWLPAQLTELPEAVSLVAAALAKPGTGLLPEGLRKSLAHLSELLRKVQHELNSNGSAVEADPNGDGESIFA